MVPARGGKFNFFFVFGFWEPFLCRHCYKELGTCFSFRSDKSCFKVCVCMCGREGGTNLVLQSQNHVAAKRAEGLGTWPYQICSGGMWKWRVPHLVYT